MLRQLREPPTPENIALFRTSAIALAQDLERELVRLDKGRRFEIPIEHIYNSVYLPSGAALADGLAGIQELQMLRQPMTAELAQTQLRVVLELLYRLVSSLSAT
jgi:hypothetical protein